MEWLLNGCWCGVDENFTLEEQLIMKRHAIKKRLAEIAREVDFRIALKQPAFVGKEFSAEIVKACEDLVKYHDYSIPALQRDFSTWGWPFHLIGVDLNDDTIAKDPINSDLQCLYGLQVFVGTQEMFATIVPDGNDIRLLRTGFITPK